jgi:lactoylglutathione lyase
MIHKLEHIGVFVNDMDVSVKFYTEVLGMKLLGRSFLEEDVELGFLAHPGSEQVQLELIGRGSNDKPDNGKVHHIAFTVSDIEAEVERLKGLGIKMIDQEPRIILDNVKIAFFFGPDGERLEFFQPKA